MFGMFKKKVDLSDLSKLDKNDFKELSKTLADERFGVILRQSAEQGNVVGQILLASMLAVLMRDKNLASSRPRVEDEFFKYSKLAAGSGDADSQFNLGKIYMSKVDMSDGKLYSEDHEYVRQAEYWLKKAQKQGHQNAVDIVPGLEDIFNMAR